jgi:molecular chaperone GrpE
MDHVDRNTPHAEEHANLTESAPDRAGLLRALRDLEAAKERVERDAQSVYDETRRNLVVQLLPILDNLDRAIRAAEASHEAPSIAEGARLVRSQIEHVLCGFGVRRIVTESRRFDPALHEAVSTVDVIDAAAHGLVVDEVEPGYLFGDALLRPAKVVVAKCTAPSHPTPFGWH